MKIRKKKMERTDKCEIRVNQKQERKIEESEGKERRRKREEEGKIHEKRDVDM